ncbi:hypothetical protein KIL84_003549 [Mauremys mutica]|uniref:Uncharacterized protein n=1 Tax=Mauremys mutica TaxID=74926 RepID=A0A9D3WUD2_9SAUR|nr:hypothetical protein KIL84_003549 [Mauremys mutica]
MQHHIVFKHFLHIFRILFQPHFIGPSQAYGHEKYQYLYSRRCNVTSPAVSKVMYIQIKAVRNLAVMCKSLCAVVFSHQTFPELLVSARLLECPPGTSLPQMGNDQKRHS